MDRIELYNFVDSLDAADRAQLEELYKIAAESAQNPEVNSNRRATWKIVQTALKAQIKRF